MPIWMEAVVTIAQADHPLMAYKKEEAASQNVAWPIARRAALLCQAQGVTQGKT